MLLQICKDVKYLAKTLKTYLTSIKTRVFNIKLDQLIKRHGTKSVVWEMQPCKYDEKLNIIK